MDLHLLVDVPHVGVHGVRRYHQLLGHVVRGVAARDEHEDLGLAPRQAELLGHLGADLVDLGLRGRRGRQRHDVELLAHQRHQQHGQHAHEPQARLGRDGEGQLGGVLVAYVPRIAYGDARAHERAGEGERYGRRHVTFRGEDAEVHDEQDFQQRRDAGRHDEGGEERHLVGQEQRERRDQQHQQPGEHLEYAGLVLRRDADAGDAQHDGRPSEDAQREADVSGGQHLPGDDGHEEIARDAGQEGDDAHRDHVLETALGRALRQQHRKRPRAVAASGHQQHAGGDGQQ